MDRHIACTVFECLASGHRLDIYRLLVRHAPAGLVAGEIGAQLGLPPTNLSFHLKTMAHAGLVRVTPEGRFQRYCAELSLMNALIEYLTAECCQGEPARCAELTVASCCPEPLSEQARPRRARRE